MRQTWWTAVSVVVLLCLPSMTQAGEMNPVVLADHCAACHGTDGKSPGIMPSLRGKPSSYIAQYMQEFKTDERKGTVMNRLAKGLSDEQILAVAKRLAGE